MRNVIAKTMKMIVIGTLPLDDTVTMIENETEIGVNVIRTVNEKDVNVIDDIMKMSRKTNDVNANEENMKNTKKNDEDEDEIVRAEVMMIVGTLENIVNIVNTVKGTDLENLIDPIDLVEPIRN